MTRARLIEAGGGAILIFFGLAFALGAFQYEIGDFANMGPGMFPLIVGIAIAGVGVPLVLLAAAASASDAELDRRTVQNRLRVLVLVCAAITVFGLLIRNFGLFPAIIGLVLLVGLTEREHRPTISIVTAVVLACLAWLIFTLGLGLNIPAFRWGA